MNLIKLDTLTILFFKNVSVTIFAFSLLFIVFSLILWIKSLFSIFIIALKEATFVVECSLSFLYIKKSLIDSSKLFLSFWWSFAEVKKFWTVLLNASSALWCWGYKGLHKFYQYLFIHKIFKEYRFWTFFCFQSEVNQEYYALWRIFLKALKIVSAFLSFNGIIHPYFEKWSTIVKIYLNPTHI